MKKIHLKEDAKILKLFDTGLGDYNDEEEKMLVQEYGVVSERAEREFDEIIDTLNRIIENA